MAVSKCKALHGKLDNVIAYITNFEKTMQGDLVYSFNCSPAFAARQMELVYMRNRKSNATRTGYHLIQSFDPEDDISPEKAFEIGKEFAKKVVGINTQYIIATHVDKDHIHNHIVFNSCPFRGESTKMYRWTPKEGKRIESINDNLCRQNGCSVIEKKSGVRGKSWSQHSKADSKTDRALCTIRGCIDSCIENVNSLEELAIKLYDEYGIDMRIGKTITFSIYDENFESNEFKCRDRRLGSAYSVDSLNNRIKGLDIGPNLVTKKIRNGATSYQKKINKVVDVVANKKAMSSAAYSNALYTSNASAKLQTFNYIRERGFESEREFLEHYQSIEKTLKENNKLINVHKDRTDKLSEKITQVKNYRDNKKIYSEYIKCPEDEKEKFKDAHNDELMDYYLAEMYFNNLDEPVVNPYKISLKDLFSELKEIKTENSRLYEENKIILKELSETKNVAYNVMKTLNINTDNLKDYSKKPTQKTEAVEESRQSKNKNDQSL